MINQAAVAVATGASPTRTMTLTVQVIEFHTENISGCISLMKQLGIRTRCHLEPPFLDEYTV